MTHDEFMAKAKLLPPHELKSFENHVYGNLWDTHELTEEKWDAIKAEHPDAIPFTMTCEGNDDSLHKGFRLVNRFGYLIVLNGSDFADFGYHELIEL